MAVYGDIQVLWGIRVESDLRVDWTNIFHSDTSVVYAIRGIVYSNDFSTSWDILSEYFRNITVTYNINEQLVNDLLVKYTIDIARAYSEINIPLPILLARDINTEYDLTEFLIGDVQVLFNIITEPRSDLEVTYDITTKNYVKRDLRAIYTLVEPISEFIIYDGSV